MNFMKKIKNNYEKFQVRGAIKEIMRNYGLRTISLKNYYDYINSESDNNNVHSVKYDIMNGYIKMHQYKTNDSQKRCGEPLETVDIDTYKYVYDTIVKILNSEHTIPNRIKRNILVKVNR